MLKFRTFLSRHFLIPTLRYLNRDHCSSSFTLDESSKLWSALIASQLPNPYSNMPTSNIESSGTSHWTPQWTLLAGAVRRNLKGQHRILIDQHWSLSVFKNLFFLVFLPNSIKHNKSYHDFFPTKTLVYNCILFFIDKSCICACIGI